VLNEMDCSPFSYEKDKPLEIRFGSIVISDLTTSGLGVGSIGSSPPSLHAETHNRIAKITNPIILNVFILLDLILLSCYKGKRRGNFNLLFYYIISKAHAK
jgi:hypothetical protein